jgi:hypothetical protein
MKKLLLGLGLVCLAAALPLFPGCTGSDDGEDGTSDATNAVSTTLSGSWVGTISQVGGVATDISMGISQNGDTLTGTYQGTGGVNGAMTGFIGGNSVEMTTVTGGGTAEWTGAVNDELTTMSGTVVIVAGGGGSGVWTLTKQ